MMVEKKKENVSVAAVIITKNEEANLPRCLNSLGWVDEIILVDSLSVDRTCEIARQFGAKVFQNLFHGYGPTKAYGVEKVSCDWILSVDADEEICPQLAVEIKAAINSKANISGYYIPRRTYFLGRWIKHSKWSPDYVLRLFRRSSGNFDQSEVHEEVIVEGKTAYLKNIMLHHSYPSGLKYREKMERYSKLGAEKIIRQGRKHTPLSLVFNPIISFYRHYIFGAGFLDGMHGFLIGILSAFGVMRKYQKVRILSKKNDD